MPSPLAHLWQPLLFLGLIAAAVFAVGVVATVLRRRAGGGAAPDPFVSLAKADALLTANEREFYQLARAILEPTHRLFAKVCLRDLVDLRHAHLTTVNRLGFKHVDFVVCEPATLAVVAAIELDDASHEDSRRAKSDEVKDAVLKRVGVPLVRVRARRTYAETDVLAALASLLPTRAPAAPGQARA